MNKKELNTVGLFLTGWILYFLIGILLLLVFQKGDLELAWNQNHHAFADYFFSYLTHLGNGVAYAVFVLFFLFKNKRFFFISFSASIVCLLTSLVMKHFFFSGEERPLAFFGDSVNIHLPSGAEKLMYGSFPSGHTLAAFSMFLLGAYFFKNKYWQLFLLLLATLVGVSRVYLMAHFIGDVVTGSFLGVLISSIVILIFQKYFPTVDSKPIIQIHLNAKAG